MHTRSIVNRLRDVGINVLAARNSALRNLVTEMPPPVVAELLGFSDTCTQRHGPAMVALRHALIDEPRSGCVGVYSGRGIIVA